MSRVKDYMRKDISTISSESTAIEASRKMEEDKVGYLIVLDGGRPVGIVTERDLVVKVIARGTDPGVMRVSDLMSSPLVTVDPDAVMEDAVELMSRNRFRRLPVVRDGILYGIFTARDLIQHYGELEKKVVMDIIRYIPY